MQHALSGQPVQSLMTFYQSEAIVFKRRGRGEEEPRLGAEEKGMLHLFPDLLGFWPFVSLLTEGVCLTKQAGTCWPTWSSFLIGSSNGEKCLGIFLFFPSTI